MNEKMHKARSPWIDDCKWPTFKGFGVTAKWTPAYINRRSRKRKLEQLKLKFF